MDAIHTEISSPQTHYWRYRVLVASVVALSCIAIPYLFAVGLSLVALPSSSSDNLLIQSGTTYAEVYRSYGIGSRRLLIFASDGRTYGCVVQVPIQESDIDFAPPDWRARLGSNQLWERCEIGWPFPAYFYELSTTSVTLPEEDPPPTASYGIPLRVEADRNRTIVLPLGVYWGGAFINSFLCAIALVGCWRIVRFRPPFAEPRS